MDGEVQYVKNTAPGLNKDGATGILAPNTGTQLGDAQAEFADQNSANTAVCQVDGEELNVENTAPGRNEEGATGTLASSRHRNPARRSSGRIHRLKFSKHSG